MPAPPELPVALALDEDVAGDRALPVATCAAAGNAAASSSAAVIGIIRIILRQRGRTAPVPSVQLAVATSLCYGRG
jgi:hypothetical protein